MEPIIDLRSTLECGQIFHWIERDSSEWEAVIEKQYVVVKESRGTIQILRDDDNILPHYFALDHDLNAIYETFPSDAVMQEALTFCRGLRILRQPLWECLATFITSSMKQVAHIRKMSFALRASFGGKVRGTNLRSYPEAKTIAAAKEDDLRACGLGFRAPNLLATARRIASGEANITAWKTLDDEALRTALCELPGVGRKVANCVMLFAYERLTAFPVDTWIARVMKQHYWKGDEAASLTTMERELSGYFGPYAGYAQQYLFHHARMQKEKRRK